MTPLLSALMAPLVWAGSDTTAAPKDSLAVAPPRLERTVVLDGVLDEEPWTQAVRLAGFWQYSPDDGRPALDSTEVLVWYSPTDIYFGIRAYESHGPVHATLADRDKIASDDHIQIFLSTYNDRRRAMVFGVNPLGVQADGTLFEGAGVGRDGVDLSPDFVFESKGRVTATGYEVEIRIPFKSLRYQPLHRQDWGINVVRRIQHSGHETTWTPARRAAASFLAQSGTLVGLTDIRAGLVLDVTPVVTTKIVGARAGDGWDYTGGSPEFGGTLRWGVTPNLALNATVNPDFSQVESDASQVVTDPRVALFFPEKRPFFLDGIEEFSTPNRLVYTRRVAAPEVAIKLTGKISGTSVALLSALDDPATSASGSDRPLYNILRVQRDVGRESRLGMVFTDREDGEDFNRVVGLDGRVVLGEVYSVRLQAAGSATRRAGVVTEAPLWQASVGRAGRTLGFRYALNAIHPDFRASSGFISRPGIVQGTVNHRIALYGKPGALAERWSGSITLDGTWQYHDFVRGDASQDRKLHVNSDWILRGGWEVGGAVFVESFGYDERLYADYAIERQTGAVVDTVPFVGTPRLPNLDFVLRVTTPEFRHVSARLFYLWGKDENFFEWASADIVFATANLAWRPTPRVRMEGSYALQQYRRQTDGTLVGRTQIPRLKFEYQLSRALFLRLVGEYTASQQDDLRDDSRTGDPLLIRDASGVYRLARATTDSRFRADVLASYQPSPGTVFYAGYGSTLGEPEAFRFRGLRRHDDAFFAKLSYLIRL